MDTCHDWGRRPSEFGLCLAEDDLAVMRAHSGAVASMRAWEHEVSRQEKEKHMPKKPRGAGGKRR